MVAGLPLAGLNAAGTGCWGAGQAHYVLELSHALTLYMYLLCIYKHISMFIDMSFIYINM